MPRSVILQHTTPDGESHYDWMIEQEGVVDEHRLLTWRCKSRPDRSGWNGQADAIAVHRVAYLEFEGVLTGGRGSVRRVASGSIVRSTEHNDGLEITIRWADCAVGYRGRSTGIDDHWVFSVD
jgi:hypothetical protein